MAPKPSHIWQAPKIWQLIPEAIKKTDSLNVFKRKIKTWIPTACPCKLCKQYIQHVGFLSKYIWCIFYIHFNLV